MIRTLGIKNEKWREEKYMFPEVLEVNDKYRKYQRVPILPYRST